MTIKKFKKILADILESSAVFITYDETDKDFNLEENEMVICGENETETFAITIIKVV